MAGWQIGCISLCEAPQASGVQGPDDLGGFPGRASEPNGITRTIRWFCRKGQSGLPTTCLIMADHNRYSVDARAAGRMVLVRSHAERIVVLLGGTRGWPTIRATSGAIKIHLRSLALLCLCWCASRVHCATARRSRIGHCRRRWPRFARSRSSMPTAISNSVKVLGAVLAHGLSATWRLRLRRGARGGDRQRRRDPDRAGALGTTNPRTPASITTPDGLRLKVEPVADCGGRYDSAYERSPDGTPRDPGRHDRIEALRHAREFRRDRHGKGLARGVTRIYPLIASLIRAERTHRQARSISYRIEWRQVPGAEGPGQVRLWRHDD